MDRHGLITASMRELERIKVIEAVVDGRLCCFKRPSGWTCACVRSVACVDATKRAVQRIWYWARSMGVRSIAGSRRAPQCTLLVYVDDATSRLMHLASGTLTSSVTPSAPSSGTNSTPCSTARTRCAVRGRSAART